MNDHELARAAARHGGDLLLELRAAGGSGAEGDRRSDDFIVELLREQRPSDAILSEESKDDLARLDAARVWIVDPLDGTREYSEAGRTDWAVHVALVVDEVPIAAAVALPAQDTVLATDAPPTLPSAGDGPVRILVSRTRPPALATALAQILGGELVPMGSAGAKTMAVVQGAADVYAHGGGQYEWDSAAPVGVARAAGCHCSRLDGSPLRYNQRDPYLPDLLVCRPELADRVLAALASAG
ncbi:MAG: 3'(2'),5'-bisphosphate nucleotidase CysQ [Actinomycetota bacterium]